MATAQIDLRRHPNGRNYPAPLQQSLQRWYATYGRLGGQDAMGAFPHAKRVLDAAIEHHVVELGLIGDTSADPRQLNLKIANIIIAHLFRRGSGNRRDFPSEDFGRYTDLVKGFETFDMLRENDLGMQSPHVYGKLLETPSLGLLARMVDIAQYGHDAGLASEKELATLDPRLFYSFDSRTGKTEYERAALAARKLYSPLADLFGYRKLAGNLFEMAYFILERGTYDQVISTLRSMSKRIEASKSVLADLVPKVRAVLAGGGYEFELLVRERKHPGKVMEKADRYSRKSGRSIREEVTGLHDLVAATVILKSRSGKPITQNEIWDFKGVANLIVREANDLHPLRKGIANADIFEDMISHPKSNGYQSYHVNLTFQRPDLVPIEFLVRNERMHRFAELGEAAHFLYKGGGPEARTVARAYDDFMHAMAHGTKDQDGILNTMSSKPLLVTLEGRRLWKGVVPVNACIGEALMCAGIDLGSGFVPDNKRSLLVPIGDAGELRLVATGQSRQPISPRVIDQLLEAAVLEPTRVALRDMKRNLKAARGYRTN